MQDHPGLGAATPFRTLYDGRWFRVEGEARWWFFFRQLDLCPEYEFGGLKLTDATAYRPDFYLHELEVWVEHKSSRPKEEAFRRCRQLAIDSGRAVLLVVGPPSLDTSIFVFCPRPANRWTGPLALQALNPLHGLVLSRGIKKVLLRFGGGVVGCGADHVPEPTPLIRETVERAMNLPLMPKDRDASNAAA